MSTPALSRPERPLWQRLLLRRLKFLLIVVALLVVVLGGSYLFAPQWLIKADTMRKAAEAHVQSHEIIAGDTQWSYYEGGDGPVIVLLHGFGADKSSWLPVAKRLTAHFHVIIPDLPGWGDSTRVEGASYNIDAQAQRLQAFVQAKDLKGFALVGHSMGGAIAGVYAAEHPEHVASLALVDSLGLKFKENQAVRDIKAGKDPFVFDDRAGFERLMALVFVKPPSIPGRFEDVFVQRNQRDRAFIERTVHELEDPSQNLAIQNRLSQFTMPVLGLWCLNDKLIDISSLESLRNGLSRSSSIGTTTMLGCNHVPILEKPEETSQVLSSFVLGH